MPDKKMNTVAVLGAGQWGTSLAMLGAKNTNILLYERDKPRCSEIANTRTNAHYLPGIKIPDNIELTNDIEEVFERCKLILPVIPSKVFREFAKFYSKHVTKDHMIVHGTKGLESGTYKRMSAILEEETKTKLIGALSGPNLAVELAKGQPGATVVASQSDAVIAEVQKIFASPQFRVYGNHDLVGVEWSGSLKNILAVASGICNELQFGQNATAMLITRGFAEMSRLMMAMGAHSYTLLGLAGIGDIITTCTSPLSRNFRAGQMLVRGKRIQEIESELAMTVEGINTIKIASQLAKEKNIELPITHALEQIVYEGKPIKESIRDLMMRPSTYEFQFG